MDFDTDRCLVIRNTQMKNKCSLIYDSQFMFKEKFLSTDDRRMTIILEVYQLLLPQDASQPPKNVITQSVIDYMHL